MKEIFPSSLNFFSVVTMKIFLIACNLLCLNEDNNKFVSFLCSDHGQNILTENSLSIHIEAGNIFYDNFNTNQIFHDFLIAHQDETKNLYAKQFPTIKDLKNT